MWLLSLSVQCEWGRQPLASNGTLYQGAPFTWFPYTGQLKLNRHLCIAALMIDTSFVTRADPISLKEKFGESDVHCW